MPGWHSIFAELLEQMNESGLIEAADEINFCLNGVLSSMEIPLLRLLESNPKFRARHVYGFTDKYEWPTINCIKQDADASTTNDYIGYAHLKGVSRDDITDQKAVDWRRHLSYWTIDKWKENIEMLDAGYETSGPNWMEHQWRHYSGNFWWANSNYIRRLAPLPDPSKRTWGVESEYLKNVILDPGNVRFEAEAWIGSADPKTAELHHSPVVLDNSFHYRFTYPESNYRTDK